MSCWPKKKPFYSLEPMKDPSFPEFTVHFKDYARGRTSPQVQHYLLPKKREEKTKFSLERCDERTRLLYATLFHDP